MKITVKNLKIMEELSEETLCFSATVYVDGKRAFRAKNGGHGGCNMYLPIEPYAESRQILARAEKYAKSLPGFYSEKYPELGEIPMDLDIVLDDAINSYQQDKAMRSHMRNSWVAMGSDIGDGQMLKWSKKYSREAVQQYLDSKYPDSKIVNP